MTNSINGQTFCISIHTDTSALTAAPADIFAHEPGFEHVVAALKRAKIHTLRHFSKKPARPILRAIEKKSRRKFMGMLSPYGIRLDNPDRPAHGPYICHTTNAGLSQA